MSRISVCLLFVICAFCIESLAVVYVSPSHPYYPLMKQYLLDDENKDIKTEDISNDDKLEDCIRKVFIIRRKLINHPVKDNPLDYRKFYIDVYARIVHDAYVKYPNDALLNALYADVVLDCSGRYKYNNEYNRDKENIIRYSDIIYHMLPFIQKNDEVPRVALTMFYVFDDLRKNLPYTPFYMRYVKTSENGGYYEKVNKDDKGALRCESPETHVLKLLGITSNKDEKGVLTLLTNYWANKINPSDIDTPSTRKQVAEAHDFMNVEENKSKAEEAWRMAMDAVKQDHQKKIKKINYNSHQDKSAASVMTVTPKGVNETLSELEKKHKMDFVEIQSFFGNRLRAFMSELKDKPDLPNLDRIRESNSEREAIVLNLWYKFAVHGKTKEVYDAVAMTDGWEAESRLVALRMICARDLKRPREELVALCDALVKLEPNNQFFRHTRLSLDAPAAPAGNAAPQTPDTYLVELQRKNYASAEDALKELETKRKWELIALELYTNKIGAFRKEFKGSPDLPNLEKVKAVQTADDAALLNLWYKYGVHRAYQEVYDAIGRKAGWEKDARLVFLRLLCGRRLNRDKAELLKLCDTLIAIEPNNQRFKHTRLSFEMN